MTSGCENRRKELSFSPKNRSSGIREVFHSGQLSDLSFFGNSNRVSEKVSGKVLVKSLARVEVPILGCNLVHLSDAIQALWELEAVV